MLVAIIVAGLTACSAGSTPSPGPAAAPTQATTTAVRAAQRTSAAAAVPSVTKVLAIVEENHSLAQMQSGMPYLYWLARHYAYSRNYHAIRHPSLPNYLAIAGGSTFGVTNDASPAVHRVRGSSVFGQALARRRHARIYAEGMPQPCSAAASSRGYAVKHNPWAYFTAERSRCRSYDVSAGGFRRAAAASALPEVGLLIPNLCNDAHNCGLRTADGWLRSQLPAVLASRDFRTGRLLVVITADEDDSHSGNRVLTVVLHRSLAGRHKVVGSPLNHYSLSRLFSQVVGARPLRHAARARSLPAAFGLRVGP